MSFEFSFGHHNKPPKKEGKLHANFNDQTNYRERTEFLDNIFCKDCKTPIFANTGNYPEQENSCPKCKRDLTELLPKAKGLQAKLREENAQNKNYIPPELYI